MRFSGQVWSFGPTEAAGSSPAPEMRGNHQMTTRAALVRMGKLVAAELADGLPGDATQQAMETVEAAPELAGDLVELLI